MVNRKDIMEAEKGVILRAILRSFVKTYLKDADYHLDVANMAKINKIMEAFPEYDDESPAKKLKKS